MIRQPQRLALLVCSILVSVAGFAVFLAQVTDGDVAQWVESLATLAAMIAASVAAVYAAGAFALEADRDERWYEERRTAQAEQVAAWPFELVFHREPSPKGGPDSVNRRLVEGCSAMLRNTSNLPIWQVEIKYHVQLFNSHGDMILSTGAGTQHLPMVTPANGGIEVPLGSMRSGNPMLLNPQQEPAQGGLRVSIEFTDAAGLRWLRDLSGRLQLVTPSS